MSVTTGDSHGSSVNSSSVRRPLSRAIVITNGVEWSAASRLFGLNAPAEPWTPEQTFLWP